MKSINQKQWLKNIERFFYQERCKWASPFIAWLREPLGVISQIGFAAFLCGLFVAPQGFVVFAAVLSVIVIGCIWPWIGIRGISCELSFSESRTEEGKSVDTTLAITNRWPWPVWGLAIEGGLSQSGEVDQTAMAVSRIAGWSRGYIQKSFTPSTRGLYPNTDTKIVTEFPFGLWKASRPVEVNSRLIVWPERFALPPIDLACGAQSWTGQPSESTNGNIGHRTTVREYRHGDSIRQINWAKTALYDKLVSYEREGVAISDATITFDIHPKIHSGVGHDSSIEWVIRIAASICETLIRQGVNVTVVAGSSQYHVNASSNSLTQLMDWFASIDSKAESVPFTNRYGMISRRTAGFSIHITTDLSNVFSQDTIVYETRIDSDSYSSRKFLHNSWITVNRAKDIPSQVRCGWRNGPRSIRHAV